MADYEKDINNIIFNKAVKTLPLRFRGAEIERATGFKKSAISGYLNNKTPVSDAFLEKFSEAFKIDLRQFGYTNGLERAETKNPQQSGEGKYSDKEIELIISENQYLRETLKGVIESLKK